MVLDFRNILVSKSRAPLKHKIGGKASLTFLYGQAPLGHPSTRPQSLVCKTRADTSAFLMTERHPWTESKSLSETGLKSIPLKRL